MGQFRLRHDRVALGPVSAYLNCPGAFEHIVDVRVPIDAHPGLAPDRVEHFDGTEVHALDLGASHLGLDTQQDCLHLLRPHQTPAELTHGVRRFRNRAGRAHEHLEPLLQPVDVLGPVLLSVGQHQIRFQLCDLFQGRVLGAADTGDGPQFFFRLHAIAGDPDQTASRAETADGLGHAGDQGDDSTKRGRHGLGGTAHSWVPPINYAPSFR